MDPILHRAQVAQIVNVHRAVELADPLDTTLALLQASRIPGQVEVDQRASARYRPPVWGLPEPLEREGCFH
jgi:hypothetical protein